MKELKGSGAPQCAGVSPPVELDELEEPEEALAGGGTVTSLAEEPLLADTADTEDTDEIDRELSVAEDLLDSDCELRELELKRLTD